MRRSLVRSLAGIVILILLLAAGVAHAQQDERPSNSRPDLPVPAQARPVLPTDSGTELPQAQSSPRLAEGLRLRVEAFDFEGNTAFSTADLRALLRDFSGRELDTEEILAARDRITHHYIDAGFATSGAVLPDQIPEAGRVRFQIVEGEVREVEVRGASRFAERYVADRLALAGRAPLLVPRLEAALRRLQRDPLIERITARLEPGETRGTSRLHIEIEEARQEDLRFVAQNDRSPSVGEETGAFRARAANLLGYRDAYQLKAWFTEGIRDVEAQIGGPITKWDTRLEARVRYTESEVVEFPFDPLDIESESLTVSLGLFQPLFRSRLHSAEVGIRTDWRRGESTLGGEVFCFQPEVIDCRPTTAVVRLIGNWQTQTPTQAVSLRSTLSIGTRALSATRSRGGRPGGQFVSWLFQARYSRALPFHSLLVGRIDFQRTQDALLSFERIAIGGARTVRGYRPNQLVRDSGVDASIEWRVPVWRRALGPSYLDLVPFADVGHAWDERGDRGDNSLLSLGLGFVARPHERIEASAYWGARLLGVERIGNGLIDHGLHLKVTVDAW